MSAEPGVFRVGLLGHGTVGAAFASQLPKHAERVARITGLRPELSGVLTRSAGSFDQILENSDLIVELIGGIDPAREYLLRAMRAGRPVGTAKTNLPPPPGQGPGTRRAARVCSCALRGRWRASCR